MSEELLDGLLSLADLAGEAPLADPEEEGLEELRELVGDRHQIVGNWWEGGLRFVHCVDFFESSCILFAGYVGLAGGGGLD